MLTAVFMILAPIAGFFLAFLFFVRIISEYINENLTLKQRIAELMEITPRRAANGRFSKR